VGFHCPNHNLFPAIGYAGIRGVQAILQRPESENFSNQHHKIESGSHRFKSVIAVTNDLIQNSNRV
jgi:hypothetical protein